MSKVIIKNKGKFVKYCGWTAGISPLFAFYTDDIQKAEVMNRDFLDAIPHQLSERTRLERIKEKYPESEIYEVSIQIGQRVE